MIYNIKITDNLIRRFECKFMESNSGCWEWFSSNNWKGYGRFHIVNNGKYTNPHAHRISYIIFKGIIPKGMTVHHKCNNKKCVNPDHLSLLTEKQNRELSGCWSAINRRKTHCINGHEFSKENTYKYVRNGSKRSGCKKCLREGLKRYRNK